MGGYSVSSIQSKIYSEVPDYLTGEYSPMCGYINDISEDCQREIYGARYDNTLTTLNTLPATDTDTTLSLQSQSSVILSDQYLQMNYVIASFTKS